MISLRPATNADAPTIRQMVREARLNPFGLDWRHFTLAIQGEDQIVGCVQGKPHGNEIVELASLVVLRAWRRQGIARLLILAIQAQHAPPLWLMCRSELTLFYEQFAFTLVADANGLPAYFRRIHRLSGLFRRLTPGDSQLAIMKWQP